MWGSIAIEEKELKAQYQVAEEGEDILPPGCYSGGEEELQPGSWNNCVHRQVGQGMPLPCLPNNLYFLSFSGMGLSNDHDGLAALLSSKVLGVLEHEENKEVGELSIEPTQDDRNLDRQIRKQNSLKNFEINMKGKWYRNARPLVGNLTPNHQLWDNSPSSRTSKSNHKGCLKKKKHSDKSRFVWSWVFNWLPI